jgi:heme-degrading monooxygenase HmoA
MFMRITWCKVRPGQWDAFERAYAAAADPTTPGLRARWVARDTVDTDAVFAITLWETRDSIRDWEGRPEYRTGFLDKVDPYTLGDYSVSVCEVQYESIGARVTSGKISEAAVVPGKIA